MTATEKVLRDDARTRHESPAIAHIRCEQNPLRGLCGAKLIGVPAGANPPNRCAECEAMWEAGVR